MMQASSVKKPSDTRATIDASHLDVRDPLHNVVTDSHQHNGGYDHVFPVGIGDHALQITRRDHAQKQHGHDRQHGQNAGGHAPMRADRLHLAAETEALADQVGQAGQDFSQVSAGLALQQHHGNEEAHIQKRNALDEIAHRGFDRRAEVLLVEQRAELAAERIGSLVPEHLQADRKRVSGAHRARNEIQRFRKLFLELSQPLPALEAHPEVRSAAQQNRQHDLAEQGEHQNVEQVSQDETHQSAHAHGSQQGAEIPVDAGLPEVGFEGIEEVQAGQDFPCEAPNALIGVDQDYGSVAFLGLGRQRGEQAFDLPLALGFHHVHAQRDRHQDRPEDTQK